MKSSIIFGIKISIFVQSCLITPTPQMFSLFKKQLHLVSLVFPVVARSFIPCSNWFCLVYSGRDANRVLLLIVGASTLFYIVSHSVVSESLGPRGL